MRRPVRSHHPSPIDSKNHRQILQRYLLKNLIQAHPEWSVDDLRKHLKTHLGSKLEPFGLMKKPYPFLDGVKPAAK